MSNHPENHPIQNKFAKLAAKGDWSGYKNLVSEINDSLYAKLNNKLPILEKFYSLLNSKSYNGFIWLIAIFAVIYFPICHFLKIIINDEFLVIVLSVTIIILSLQTPLYFIFLGSENKYTKW